MRAYLIIVVALALATTGCLSIFPFYTSPNPAMRIAELDPPKPQWYMIGDRECYVLVLSVHGRRLWFVGAEEGVEQWHAARWGRVRSRICGRKPLESYETSEGAIRRLPDEYAVVRQGNILTVVDGLGPGGFSSSWVWVNVAQLFRENPHCIEVWLDDGIKGVVYDREMDVIWSLKDMDYSMSFERFRIILAKGEDYYAVRDEGLRRQKHK